jgi:hypothetical protein
MLVFYGHALRLHADLPALFVLAAGQTPSAEILAQLHAGPDIRSRGSTRVGTETCAKDIEAVKFAVSVDGYGNYLPDCHDAF